MFQAGLGCHHAGMLRSDRGLTERSFEDGAIKVGTKNARNAKIERSNPLIEYL